ncbi:MAG: hypothetical protein JSW27_19860 [Phycisphaerales bacterium]|nr:MAG: hypothetical protein JSW27_19860 [Phycisphaerales bacterium]
MSRLVAYPALFLLMTAFCGVVDAGSGEAIHLAARWELFVDRFLIDQIEGDVALRLHRPTAREVVLVHDKPCEGNTCGYHTIFQDGPLYRMYYRGWDHDMATGKQRHPAVVCYAQSGDGIHWERPTLGLVEFAGSKANNIIWDRVGTHNFVPFKDANPQCPVEARYKAVGRGEGEDGRKLFAFLSPDGIHWRLLADRPILTEGAFDSQNLVFWDRVRAEYRCYFRDFRDGRRDVKVATSKDFVQWSPAVWLAFPDAPAEHLYTNQIMPYYRAPHLLVGFPTRFVPDRGALTEGLFMSSRDGVMFHRWAEAFIRPGAIAEKWHNRSNYIWWGLVETASALPGAGKELSLYTNERYYYEGQGVKTRRYTCRIDGFVSLAASYAGGEVLTRPLVFAGDRLAINFSTSAAGGLCVQIEDATGHALPGFAFADCPEIYGDSIERTVTWQAGSDLRALAGRVIRLRFSLRDGDLYAFGFGRTADQER